MDENPHSLILETGRGWKDNHHPMSNLLRAQNFSLERGFMKISAQLRWEAILTTVIAPNQTWSQK